jgi:DNA polymerase-3 subunit gamma/tau
MHTILYLASHFRDLLVSKTPATLSLLEVGEQAQNVWPTSTKMQSRLSLKRN